jgi:type III pantothenate kinase
VNAYAAHRLHGGPLVVADVGTAITVDAVGHDGGFLGGAIAAGPALALRALADHTAKLPRVTMTVPPRAIGRDTVSALKSGAAFGWRDLVGGLIDRVRAEVADLEGIATGRVQTVLTGGFSASAWAKALGADVVDEHLTLKGLAHFYAEVVGAPVEAAR